MYKKIELITNISIVFIAALLAVVVVKNHLLPSRVKEITEGNTIQLTDVDWTENKHTLLLALSPRCRFCVDSAPFYQRLVKKADDDHIALIVLTPVPTAQGSSLIFPVKSPHGSPNTVKLLIVFRSSR